VAPQEVSEVSPSQSSSAPCRAAYAPYAPYAPANVLFFFSLFASVTRAAGWRSPRQWGPFAALCVAALLAHWAHMFLHGYNFSLNILVCIAAFVATWTTLLYWAVRSRHPGRRALALCCGTLCLAGTAEVWDFPPAWGLLDAHALWHCVTPGCVWLWYRFVEADCVMWGGAGGDTNPGDEPRRGGAQGGHADGSGHGRGPSGDRRKAS